MTSESVFVWITLPGAVSPTVAGRLDLDENGGTFVYGRSYLRRGDKVEIDPSELPLTDLPYQVEPDRHGGLPGAIRDASPDSWGRYVQRMHHDQDRPSEVSLLMRSPDDRVGALAFTTSAIDPPLPLPPAPTAETIEALAAASRRQREERGPMPTYATPPLSPRTQAVVGDPRTSLGGARPKVTVREDDALWLAKINKQDDDFDYARTEAAMLDLARLCGIEAPDVAVRRFGSNDALFVKRFDRDVRPDGGIARTRFASALTCLKADESDREPQSYLRLVDEVRRVGHVADGPKLFRRMVFNALIGNGDDHLRNHGLIATDGGWRLSPVYDLVPSPTHSQHVRLALAVGERSEREFTVPTVLAVCGRFGLAEEQAKATIADMAETVARRWHEVLRIRGVNESDLGHLRSAFLNPGLDLNSTGHSRPTLSEPPTPEVTTRTSGRGRPTLPLIVRRAELTTAMAALNGRHPSPAGEVDQAKRSTTKADAPADAVVRALVAGIEGLAFQLHDAPDDPAAPSTTLTGAAAIAALRKGFGRGRHRRIWVDLDRATAGKTVDATEDVVRLVSEAHAETSGRRIGRAPVAGAARRPNVPGRG